MLSLFRWRPKERLGVMGLGLAFEFRPRSGVQKHLRRWVLPGAVALFFAASLAPVPPALAQSLWQGTTSTYETNTNWLPPTTPPSPPIASGQQAVFDNAGSTTVNVTSSAIAPNSWTFNSGAQSYTISGGAVNFSAAGPTGGIIDNANALQTITIQNNIGESTPGVQLQLNGSSRLVLLGNNTYTGGTFINTICGCGTLQLGDPTHTASIIGDVTNQATFNIVNANTSGITSITNIGGLTQFFNSTTASSATIVNNFGGTTQFNDSSNAANANITNLSFGGSTLFFNNSSAGNAVITNKSNAGSLLSVGLGFFDNSTAANATIVNTNGGFIGFGKPFFIFGSNNDAPTAANAIITNTKGSEIDFAAFSTAGNAIITTDKGSAVVFVDRSTGGNAQFITNGSGVVDFGGQSLSPSVNKGPNNDGVVTAGSIAGSGTYIIGGITLIVGGNNLSTEVSGVIADSCGCGPSPLGSLTKVGSGTLTLSGNNTYTGLTRVSGGTLLVTGSLDSSTHFSEVVVDSGATLGGTGSLRNALLNPGATLAPGLPTALGTLTVNDGLGLVSGDFYNVKVTSTGSDLTKVVPNLGPTATAALGGTVQVTSLNSSYKFNSPYTILSAQGGFFGPSRFDSLVTPLGINGLLSYTTTDVDLTLMSALGQLPVLDVNQHNVAISLDNAFNTVGNSGGLGAIFGSNVLQNLTQISGELATGVQSATYNAMNLFISSLTDPFVAGRGGSPGAGGAQGFTEDESASAYAARQSGTARDAFARIPTKAVARNDLLDNRWSVWGTAFGGGANIYGDAALGSNNADVRAFGLAAGFDYRVSPSTIAGFALAGGGTNFSVAGFGSGRSDMFQAGAFVRHTVGAAYVTGALAYGGQEVTTDRIVTVAGFDHLQARFNTNTVSGRVEGGYRFVTPWMGVTPYAAGQFTTIDLPAYAEQVIAGTGNFALAYAAKTATDARTELGVRTDRSYAMRDGVLTLRGRFAWAHDFTTDRNVGAVFQSLPGSFFVVNGAAQAHDSALTTVSAEMRWMNHWSAAATFEGEFSPVMNSYAGKGVVRYTW